jgi:hypothetical protein
MEIGTGLVAAQDAPVEILLDHADAGAPHVKEAETARLDGQENNVGEDTQQEGLLGVGGVLQAGRENGQRGDDGPVGRGVQARPPHQRAVHLGPVEMSQGGDVFGPGQRRSLELRLLVGHLRVPLLKIGRPASELVFPAVVALVNHLAQTSFLGKAPSSASRKMPLISSLKSLPSIHSR